MYNFRVSFASAMENSPPGRAVQVEPFKSKLELPGTKRLKLKCDIVVSTSSFKFNLRCYTRETPSLTGP